MNTRTPHLARPRRRIVLADGHGSVRQMLSLVLHQNSAYEVVAEASSGPEALRHCRALQPCLLVTDLRLPEVSGVEVLRALRAEQPLLRVLIYTGTSNATLVRAALELRPHGFVHKEDSLADLLTGLREICAGHSYLTAFATQVADTAQLAAAAPLGERERSVLQMIAEGRTSRHIASVLSVSPKTVEHYRGTLMQKLNLHDIASLTRFAIQQGLVPLE